MTNQRSGLPVNPFHCLMLRRVSFWSQRAQGAAQARQAQEANPGTKRAREGKEPTGNQASPTSRREPRKPKKLLRTPEVRIRLSVRSCITEVKSITQSGAELGPKAEPGHNSGEKKKSKIKPGKATPKSDPAPEAKTQSRQNESN